MVKGTANKETQMINLDFFAVGAVWKAFGTDRLYRHEGNGYFFPIHNPGDFPKCSYWRKHFADLEALDAAGWEFVANYKAE